METTINKSGIWDSSTDHVDSIILDGTSSPITLQINTGTTSWGEGDNADSPFTANALTIDAEISQKGCTSG